MKELQKCDSLLQYLYRHQYLPFFYYFHTMRKMPGLLLLIFLIVESANLSAQQIEAVTAPIIQKMEWYGAKQKSPFLFVHFDKNIYTNSEHVWFTAYLMNSSLAMDAYNTLSVNLIKNDDSTVVAEQKFVMEKGLSFGHMLMPDSIPPGDYSFLVYTNLFVNDRPVVSFVQPVTLKSSTDAGYIASIKLAETILPQADSAKLVFKAFSKDILTLVSFADVSYTLGRGRGQVKGKFKTDIYGEAKFAVPLRSMDASNNRLRLQSTFKKETKNLQLQLPVSNSKAIVHFFPESGTLREGNKNTIGWEVKSAYGEAILISGVLYRDDEPFDTIQTNGYGIGRFSLTPDRGHRYYVRLIKKGQEEVAYPLPNMMEEGLSVTVENALCNDTLVARVTDRSKGIYACMIHNYAENFIVFRADMSTIKDRTFRVLLSDLSKGIYTLTFLDSIGRPVAERLFFAHYNQRTEVNITTDETVYKTRQKVNLALKLRNVSGSPVSGYVSVACVQDNRIDQRKMTDIENYLYLTNELASIPFKKDPMGNDAENRSYLEDILLIKGWRRYTWPELEKAKPGDTLRELSSLQFIGNVTHLGKPVTKSLLLYAFSDSLPHTISTDEKGQFGMENEELKLQPDKKLMLFVTGKKQEEYEIHIEDPYKISSAKLASQMVYEDMDAGATEKSTDAMMLKAGEKATTLQEVIVKSSKKDDFMIGGLEGSMQRNACGDYVCQYGILNCANHTFGRLPIAGKSYPNGRMGGSVIVYNGCRELNPENKFMLFVKGIYTAKEFYNTDYTKVAASEQMFLSTIFWNHLLQTDDKKTTELSFYTSDIAGKFRIIVQGITTEGVVHGEYVFNVKKE